MEIYNKKYAPPKEKKPHGREPKFSIEYMMMVVKKVEDEGMTYREASRTFGISHGCLNGWLRKYRKGTLGNRKMPEPSPGTTVYVLEERLKEMKQQIGELYLENLMLKKALFHSRQSKKENSSVITSENLDQFQGGAK